MTTIPLSLSRLRTSFWLTVVPAGGVAWNVFGIVQFAGYVTGTESGMIAAGYTPDQINVMSNLPAWMTAAFAIGVFGGLAGSVLLLLRRAASRQVLLLSLVAYVALWIGDAMHRVFATFGMPQVIILSLVVAIAAALYAISCRMVANT